MKPLEGRGEETVPSEGLEVLVDLLLVQGEPQAALGHGQGGNRRAFDTHQEFSPTRVSNRYEITGSASVLGSQNWVFIDFSRNSLEDMSPGTRARRNIRSSIVVSHHQRRGRRRRS